MTKLFKNSKSILSLVLAFAVLAVSLFTGVAIHSHAAVADEGTIDMLEYSDDLLANGSTSKYFDTNVADNGETGDSWENAIIIDSAEELVYLCKASGNETKGKYYKVADGIAGFNLSTASLDVDGTLADNYDIIKNSGKNHSGNTPGFQGHFDGNGATVYGATVNAAPSYIGLFSCTFGEVTIKNIHVNKANFVGTNAAGGIIGYHKADSMCTVTIENCSVTDSHLEVTGTGYGCGVGAILGYGSSAPSFIDENDTDGDGNITERIYVNVAYNIKNCYVNLNEADFVSKAEDGVEDSGERVCHGGLIGIAGSNAAMMSDCVVIGVKPYGTMEGTSANDVQHSGLEQHFANVYTTEDVAITNVNLGGAGALANRNFTGKVFPLTDAQLKGAAAVDNMNLDWSVWMADANGYPQLANAHKNVTLVDNENGTHAATCACGFGGMAVECTYVDGTCACGAELTCGTRNTIYWDGTKAAGLSKGSGTKDDPYIITTAAELAYVVGQKAADYAVTDGKYFKVDDSIGAIVLQPESKAADIKALDSAAAVKSYFESGSDFLSWQNYGWEGSTFCGVLDFNGVTIYGLYQKDSSNNAALIANVDAGAVIRNVALKNSYLTSASSAANYQVGGLVANTNNSGYGKKVTGIIWFDGCVVANNYMYNNSTSHDRSGVIIGASSESVYMDNCLVYGNDATYGDAVTMSIWSSATNGIIVSDSVVAPEGLELVDDGAETPRYYNKVRNSIIFGAKPYDLGQIIGSRFNDPKCFENVLTDADPTADVFSNGKTMTLTDEQMKTVTLADLATIELGDAFIKTNSYPELKAFHDAEFSEVKDNGDGTHGISCSCGLAISAEAHVWENGACDACGAKCKHNAKPTFIVTSAATCTEGEKGNRVCSLCGYVLAKDISGEKEALGHDLKLVAGKNVTCTEAGVKDYYDCSRCDLVAEDAAGTKVIENLDQWKVIAAKGHTQATDDSGVVWSINDEGHAKVCGVCNATYDSVAHVGEVVADGVNGHTVKCTVCLYESPDVVAHVFGEDNVCDTCNWACEAHTYEDGETTELGLNATPTACKTVEQICSICGHKGEDKIIGHEAGEWETPGMDMNKVHACAGEGQHTEVKICQVCFFEVENRIVTDPKTGHSFVEYEAEDATCATTGSIAYKLCEVCWNNFAIDAADDEAYENALSYEELEIPVDSTKHNWEEIGVDATCYEDGVVTHYFCLDCYAIVVDQELVEANWDSYYEYDENGNPVGVGAILDSSYGKYENEALADFIAKNYADSGIEVPEYPAADATFEEMNAYYEVYDAIFPELYAIDENVYTAWEEYWTPLWADTQLATRYLFVVAAATEEGVDLVIPATGHTLVKKDEVAATYEADGTKAHWACEDCGKLFSDAEGKNEVTAEDLVIAKLVKEEEKPADKPEEKPADKPAGDTSDKSPATGESVAAVAAVAALMGAAFVLVRKSRKA